MPTYKQLKHPNKVKRQIDPTTLGELDALLENPNMRQMLHMISAGEGTLGKGQNGYNILNGDGQFEDYSRHPRILNVGWDSTAAGKYQITKTNLDYMEDKLGINLEDFSPRNQDRMAAAIIAIKHKKSGALEDILAGDLETARKKLTGEWLGLKRTGEVYPAKTQFPLLAGPPQTREGQLLMRQLYPNDEPVLQHLNRFQELRDMISPLREEMESSEIDDARREQIQDMIRAGRLEQMELKQFINSFGNEDDINEIRAQELAGAEKISPGYKLSSVSDRLTQLDIENPSGERFTALSVNPQESSLFENLAQFPEKVRGAAINLGQQLKTIQDKKKIKENQIVSEFPDVYDDQLLGLIDEVKV
jgi:muramidase (phage lysozyme)